MTDVTDLTVPAFWDAHRAPPQHRCVQPCPYCQRGAALEWTCGPFSVVRAMKRLGTLLDGAGLTDLAPLCAKASAGYVESRINDELTRVRYHDDPDRWFRLHSLKNAARNIRKWGIEP